MNDGAKWLIGIAAVAALLAGVGYATKAKAADKAGGDCCADLEERLAELEAVSARKGTRKVKLTISGVVHKGILTHNNDELPGKGKLSIYDGTTDPSRIRVAGEAKMSPNWAAGFVIEIAYAGDTARGVDTGKALFAIDGADGKNEFQIGDKGMTTRHSFVYLDGPIGRLSVGQQSTATDGIIEVNLSQSNIATKALQYMPLNFGGAVPGVQPTFDGGRAQALRYDTPTIAGFVGTAAWQQDDSFDAAIKFAQEFGQVRVAAALGYRDQKSQTLLNMINLLDILTVDLNAAHKSTAGSVSVMHVPTGVYLNAYASQVKYDATLDIALLPPLFSASIAAGSETVKGWGAQVGIEKNWTGYGASTVFALYEQTNGQALWLDVKTYGVGFAQHIDSLSTTLYATAKRHDPAAVDASSICVGICKATDVFMLGAAVRF